MVHIIDAKANKGITLTHCGLEYVPSMPAVRYQKPIGTALANVGKHLCGKCIVSVGSK